MRIPLLALLLAATGVASASDSQSLRAIPDHGWFFYETRPAPENPPVPREPTNASPAGKPEPLSARWFKENLDHYKEAAIDNPTPENIRLYLYLQRYAMDRSEGFAKAAQVAVMQDPTLDEGQRGPITASQKIANGPVARAAMKTVMSNLAGDTGLWFFFRSDCPFCHQQVAALQALAYQYGFDVLPISIDGLPLTNGAYPNFVTDTGQAVAMGVTNTPTFFLMRRDGEVLKLAQGLQTLPEFEDRILELGRTKGWIDDAAYNAAKGVQPNSLVDKSPLSPALRSAPPELIDLLARSTDNTGTPASSTTKDRP